MLDPSRATTLAAKLRASRFVLGSITSVGGGVRARLALHDSVGALAAPEIHADGRSDDAFRLSDELTAALLERTIGPASARVVRSAALTTTSTPALREFLRAERALRRARYDSAIAGFQRAVALDSAFGLAYYRLAVASGLYDREPAVSAFAIEGAAPTALDRALANADRLPERERRLLAGYAAFRRGRADEAERHYLALLRDYPDDVETRFLLAEVRFRYNALRGRHPGEAGLDYRRVQSYDPGFFCPT